MYFQNAASVLRIQNCYYCENELLDVLFFMTKTPVVTSC